MHLWEQDILPQRCTERVKLWSTYWGVDYHRWAVAGPWWAQRWPPSSSSGSPVVVWIVHAGLSLLGVLRLQDPESLGAVLGGWVLSAWGGKGEWGHGAKGDESRGHPWGDKITLYSDKITLYSHTITSLTTLSRRFIFQLTTICSDFPNLKKGANKLNLPFV